MPRRLWSFPVQSLGIGGVVANDDYVIASGRDAKDSADVFYCIDSATGIEVWRYSYPAPGNLDYGNSPRASPYISESRAVLLGAFGHLACIEIETGEVIWKSNLVHDLGGKMPAWGYCGSPLIDGNRLYVQPGGQASHIAALDLRTGKPIWKTPGNPVAYASPVLWGNGQQKQIIGFDANGVCGWNAQNGKQVWSVRPKEPSDFNVPSPIVVPTGIVLVSENNGTRYHQFDSTGMLQSTPSSQMFDLCGDTHTPIAIGSKIVGIHNDLFVLESNDDLKLLNRIERPEMRSHCSIIGFENRALVLTEHADLFLFTVESTGARELGKTKLPVAKGEILAHPAVHGGVIYIRTPGAVEAWSFKDL